MPRALFGAVTTRDGWAVATLPPFAVRLLEKRKVKLVQDGPLDADFPLALGDCELAPLQVFWQKLHRHGHPALGGGYHEELVLIDSVATIRNETWPC